MIYTSYFAKLRKIPDDIVPISVARITPKWYNGLECKSLAPSYFLLEEYKQGEVNEEEYAEIYAEQLIDIGSCSAMVDWFYEMSDGRDVVLLCYESPEKFCHRHLIAKWLNKNGFECKEFEN